jgi:EAL domain-containing protein (putative c-di-GMP-specific phosphodiesterase class I)/integral membrane sensor domain MASE1
MPARHVCTSRLEKSVSWLPFPSNFVNTLACHGFIENPPLNRQNVLRVGWIALVVASTSALSRWLAFSDQSFSLVWPAAGIGFAVVWAYGWTGFVGLALGLAIWALGLYGFVPVALGAIIAALAGPVLAAWTLQRASIQRVAPSVQRLGRGELRADSLTVLFMVELLLAAPVAAAIGSYVLVANGIVSAGYVEVFMGYWIVETLGATLFAPAALAWIASGAYLRPWSRLFASIDRWMLVIVLIIASLQIILGAKGAPDYARALLFLYFPVLAAVAIRDDPLKVNGTLVVAIVCILSVAAFGAFGGQGSKAETAFKLVEQSLLMFILAGMCQVLLVIAAERRDAQQRLAEAERRCPQTGLLNESGLRAGWPDVTDQARVVFGFSVANFGTSAQMLGYEAARQLLMEVATRLAAQTGIDVKWARLDGGVFAAVVKQPMVLKDLPRLLQEKWNGTIWSFEDRRLPLATRAIQLTIPAGFRVTADEALLAMRLAIDEAEHVLPDHRVEAMIDMPTVARQRAFAERLEWARHIIHEARFILFAQALSPARPTSAAPPIDLEILLRVPGADGQPQPPSELLATAMRGGLMSTLDRAVIRQTFEWYARHPQALMATQKCAINLSGASLSERSLPEYVDRLRAEYGLPAGVFAFEVTESEALSDPLGAIEVLEQLREQGFRVALDDFGTGFATFDYLKRLRADYLKIDGSFIKDLEADAVDADIVRSIVTVARRLGIATVAEHVWNAKIQATVIDLGIDYLQGFAIARPMPLSEVYPGYLR